MDSLANDKWMHEHNNTEIYTAMFKDIQQKTSIFYFREQ